MTDQLEFIKFRVQGLCLGAQLSDQVVRLAVYLLLDSLLFFLDLGGEVVDDFIFKIVNLLGCHGFL